MFRIWHRLTHARRCGTRPPGRIKGWSCTEGAWRYECGPADWQQSWELKRGRGRSTDLDMRIVSRGTDVRREMCRRKVAGIYRARSSTRRFVYRRNRINDAPLFSWLFANRISSAHAVVIPRSRSDTGLLNIQQTRLDVDSDYWCDRRESVTVTHHEDLSWVVYRSRVTRLAFGSRESTRARARALVFVDLSHNGSTFG